MTEQAKDKILLSRLGFYLDGWADMVEGMGEKAVDVRKNLITELNSRDMPEVEVKEIDAQPVWLSSDTRPYNITTTSPGATTTIYVGKHGNDLYTSWRVFLKPILNKDLLLNLLKISGVVGGAYYVFFIIAGFFRGLYEAVSSDAAIGFGEQFFTILRWSMGSFVGLAVLISILGLLEPTFFKDTLRKANKLWIWIVVSFLTFSGRLLADYIMMKKTGEEITLFKLLWYPALCGAITFLLGISFIALLRALIYIGRNFHESDFNERTLSYYFLAILVIVLIFSNPIELWNNLSEIFSIFWFNFLMGLGRFTFALSWVLYTFVGGIVLLILGGLFMYKSAIYYFIVQPNYFDADDITAMTFTVHKSLLRVLDNQGIDVSKLRLKQKFTGGRKGEDI